MLTPCCKKSTVFVIMFLRREATTVPSSDFADLEEACLCRLQLVGETPSAVAKMMGREFSTVVRHFKTNAGKANKSLQ